MEGGNYVFDKQAIKRNNLFEQAKVLIFKKVYHSQQFIYKGKELFETKDISYQENRLDH